MPDKVNSSADACSRYPVKTSFSSPIISIDAHSSVYDTLRSPAMHDEIISALNSDNQIEATTLAAFIGRIDETDIKLLDFVRVKEASSGDRDINELLNAVISGFPGKSNDCSPNIQRYWNIRNDLSALGNLVLFGRRIIIPIRLRKEILENLHSAHQGETGMKARATTCVYWPGITGDIKNRKLQCRECNDMAPSQTPEPYLTSSSPDYPFEKVVSDYFSLHGHKYLLYADRYSGWITIVKSNEGEGNATPRNKLIPCTNSVWTNVKRSHTNITGAVQNPTRMETASRREGIRIGKEEFENDRTLQQRH